MTRFIFATIWNTGARFIFCSSCRLMAAYLQSHRVVSMARGLHIDGMEQMGSSSHLVTDWSAVGPSKLIWVKCKAILDGVFGQVSEIQRFCPIDQIMIQNVNQ